MRPCRKSVSNDYAYRIKDEWGEGKNLAMQFSMLLTSPVQEFIGYDAVIPTQQTIKLYI
jgi:hypothetical protein